ncbi:MAG TPA: alpha/beta hydrolase, partial [Solirubrobacterales bacterium]|nr:alpha/beta hydrolase [Solirubrobacterales bacterium]
MVVPGLGAVRDRVEGLVARSIPLLPGRLARVLAGRPVRIDGQELHPQVQLALRLERLTGGSDLVPVPEARARRRHDARVFAGARIEVGRVEEIQVAGPAGAIPARLYVPAVATSPAPLIVYYHGGGHVIGNLDTHDQPCRFLTRATGALVLAVDYRLAPEHRFPAAVEDAFAAFLMAHSEAERIGADPERVAVAGDSAGGNLAAVVCQLAVAAGGPAPVFQALIYPVTDYSAKRRSYELFGEGFFLTREEMDWYRDNYFSNPEDREDPRASPLLAGDFSGLPPALVVSAGFDPLRDEAEDYAERLRVAGVPTSLRREPDLVHGFINAVGLG